MAKFLALQIRLGKITIEDVPAHLQALVQAELDAS